MADQTFSGTATITSRYSDADLFCSREPADVGVGAVVAATAALVPPPEEPVRGVGLAATHQGLHVAYVVDEKVYTRTTYRPFTTWQPPVLVETDLGTTPLPALAVDEADHLYLWYHRADNVSLGWASENWAASWLPEGPLPLPGRCPVPVVGEDVAFLAIWDHNLAALRLRASTRRLMSDTWQVLTDLAMAEQKVALAMDRGGRLHLVSHDAGVGLVHRYLGSTSGSLAWEGATTLWAAGELPSLQVNEVSALVVGWEVNQDYARVYPSHLIGSPFAAVSVSSGVAKQSLGVAQAWDGTRWLAGQDPSGQVFLWRERAHGAGVWLLEGIGGW